MYLNSDLPVLHMLDICGKQARITNMWALKLVTALRAAVSIVLFLTSPSLSLSIQFFIHLVSPWNSKCRYINEFIRIFFKINYEANNVQKCNMDFFRKESEAIKNFSYNQVPINFSTQILFISYLNHWQF